MNFLLLKMKNKILERLRFPRTWRFPRMQFKQYAMLSNYNMKCVFLCMCASLMSYISRSSVIYLPDNTYLIKILITEIYNHDTLYKNCWSMIYIQSEPNRFVQLDEFFKKDHSKYIKPHSQKVRSISEDQKYPPTTLMSLSTHPHSEF